MATVKSATIIEKEASELRITPGFWPAQIKSDGNMYTREEPMFLKYQVDRWQFMGFLYNCSQIGAVMKVWNT